jgi:RNA polymerase sigma factor (sigma-70 family)
LVEVVDKNRLMQGCAQGGRALDQAIVEVHRHYWSDLLREARRVLGTVEAAHDAAQEALIKVWKECGKFRGDAEVWAWLRPIVRRTAIDILRTRRVEVPLVDDDNQVLAEVETILRDACNADAGDPLALAECAESRHLFESCYAHFAADHPESACALRWVAEDELDYAEVARQLGRTPHATREFVSQSRKKARVYLAPWYGLVCRSASAAAEQRAPRSSATAADRHDSSAPARGSGAFNAEGAR